MGADQPLSFMMVGGGRDEQNAFSCEQGLPIPRDKKISSCLRMYEYRAPRRTPLE